MAAVVENSEFGRVVLEIAEVGWAGAGAGAGGRLPSRQQQQVGGKENKQEAEPHGDKLQK